MFSGHSINLSLPREDQSAVFDVTLPVPPLYVGRFGPVLEVVFWSEEIRMWVHGVSQTFERPLPPGHVQVAVGDLHFIRIMKATKGPRVGLVEAVTDLVNEQVPEEC